jgi:hypothetical protein
MEAPRFNGVDMAAIVAAAFSIFLLGLVQIWTVVSEAGKEWVFGVGKAWMPHAEHIGPYSGKETIMAVGWLVAWLVLHLALRHKHVNPRPWFFVALAFILMGVVLIWPPVWHFVEG